MIKNIKQLFEIVTHFASNKSFRSLAAVKQVKSINDKPGK